MYVPKAQILECVGYCALVNHEDVSPFLVSSGQVLFRGFGSTYVVFHATVSWLRQTKGKDSRFTNDYDYDLYW